MIPLCVYSINLTVCVCPVIGVGWEDVDGKVGVTLELCAGIVDKDLSLEDTAVAEVLEEKSNID